jgi:hypothetical protein
MPDLSARIASLPPESVSFLKSCSSKSVWRFVSLSFLLLFHANRETRIRLSRHSRSSGCGSWTSSSRARARTTCRLRYG